MVVEIKHTFVREDPPVVLEMFPGLGFAGEVTYSIDEIIVYEWEFKQGRVVIWRQRQKTGLIEYALNLYRPERSDKSATHYQDRMDVHQEPIVVADALEAQLAIFHLLQKHNLPYEVTHEENIDG